MSFFNFFKKSIPLPEIKQPELPKMRKTNQAGIDLIKSCEGCVLKAYPDPGTGAAPWTIGYGHTGPEVMPGNTVTQEQAEELLKADLERFEKTVIDATATIQISDNQFAALVSFTYNCGPGNFLKSGLLRKTLAADFTGAAEEFPKWNKAAGKVLPGLVKRREAEKELYLKV